MSWLITVSGEPWPMNPRASTKRRKRRPNTRLRLVSMLVTVALLAGMAWFGSYLLLQPKVEELPPTIPFSPQGWMSYVPDSAEYVAYVNYRAAYEASGNYSLFGTNPLLEIYSPPFNVYPTSVEYELAINLAGQTSKVVSSASVIKVELSELGTLNDTLRSSPALHRTTHGQHVIFNVLIHRKEAQPPLVSASLAIANGHLLFAEGPDSIDSISQVLDSADHGQRQLFSQSSMRTALYASGGTGADYLALFIVTFPTQIEGAKIAVKTVSSASGTVSSRIAFLFDSQDQARGQYENVRKLYAGGNDYRIVGPFVVVTFRYDIALLGDQMRGL